MAGIDDIQGQDTAVAVLKRALFSGRIPNGWLFCGPAGVGKRRTARALAVVLNCEETSAASPNSACGRCSCCRTLIGGNHPDYLEIEPVNNEIRVAQIRSICTALEKKTFHVRKRLVVIDQAERMTPGSANAALKIMEEPPDDTHFILITEEVEKLLPTIRSRCQQVVFGPLPSETIERLLIQEHGIDTEKSRLIAALSNGSMQRALLLAQPKWFLWRSWIYDVLERIHHFNPAERLLFGEMLLTRADHIAESLDWMASWYRDAISCLYGNTRLFNIDREHPISVAVRDRKAPHLTDTLLAITRMRQQLPSRVNLKLRMDNLVLTLA